MVQLEQQESMASTSAARLENGRPAKRAKHNQAVDFAKHFSEEGRSRQYPSLRKIICQFHGAENVVPMHGGLPPSDSFPLSSMLLRLRNGQSVDLVDDKKVCAARTMLISPDFTLIRACCHPGCSRAAVLHDRPRLSCPAQCSSAPLHVT